jgi:hypothetical protein
MPEAQQVRNVGVGVMVVVNEMYCEIVSGNNLTLKITIF